MTARPENKLETHFEKQGTLPTPLVIGRIVRFLLGVWLLWAFIDLARKGPVGLIGTSPPLHWSLALGVVFGLWLTPYVVNIGFTKNWKAWPRYAVLIIAALLVGVDLLVYETWWAPPLGTFILAWMLYWLVHLGLSFVLSAFIATPGCEMRAIPHFWTLLTGRHTHEHYCPGLFDRLDRWERERTSP